MSGAYVRRNFQSSTASNGNDCAAVGGVWDPNAGNGHGCFKACPDGFPYPKGDYCYQFPADYKPPAPETAPLPASQGGGNSSGSNSSVPAAPPPPVQGNTYAPPNPANGNNSNNNHGGNTNNNNSSVAPPDDHQQAYNQSSGYNDVFYSDPGVTGAPADVGVGAESGSSSKGMDTNTLLLIGGLAVAGILAMKMMKK